MSSKVASEYKPMDCEKNLTECDGAVSLKSHVNCLSNSAVNIAPNSAVLPPHVSTQSVESTPLSSMSSATSLIRHLFEMRRRQQEQRQKLDQSIMLTKPIPVPGNCVSHHKDEKGCITPVFTSTPDCNKENFVTNTVSDSPTGSALLKRAPLQNIFSSVNIEINEQSNDAKDSPSVNNENSNQYNPENYQLLSVTKSERCNNLKVNSKSYDRKCAGQENDLRGLNSPALNDDRALSCSNRSFQELIEHNIRNGSYSTTMHSSCTKPEQLQKTVGTSCLSKSDHLSVLPDEANIGCNEPFYNNKVKKFPFLKKGKGLQRYRCRPIKLKKCSNSSNNAWNSENRLVLEYENVSTPITKKQNREDRGRDDVASTIPFSPISLDSRREVEELAAFERLEELAENSSFLSHASTVNSLLQKGLESSSETVSSSFHHSPFPAPIDVVNDKPNCVESDRFTNNKGTIVNRPRTVQFNLHGAQVLEYCVNDSMSDVVTKSDTSELLDLSDLEALDQLHRDESNPLLLLASRFAAVAENRAVVTDKGESSRALQDADGQQRNAESTEISRSTEDAKSTVLQFSPPKVPANSASYDIWNSFGRRRAHLAKLKENAKKKLSNQRNKCMKNVGSMDKAFELQPAELRRKLEEVDAHKVLLVSKVHELEREIASFQRQNAHMTQLKQTLQREGEQLKRERELLETNISEHKRKIEEYFELEKKKLWMEKCKIADSKKTMSSPDGTLEIINLKEEILLLKKDLERKDSMHNFMQNKLRDRIKELDLQKKDLVKKTEKLCLLEKENLSLKHQIDRLKLCNRTKTNNVSEPPPLNENKRTIPKSVRFAENKNDNSEERSKLQLIYKPEQNFVDSFSSRKQPCLPLYNAYKFSDNLSSPTTTDGAPEETLTSTPESRLADGSTLITFSNGNKKRVYPSGRVQLEYSNGDIEETLPDLNQTVYYYGTTGARVTTHHDSGLEEILFTDGQLERRKPDGSVDIVLPDGTKTARYSDGSEELVCADGTVVTVSADRSEKVLRFVNGQVEVHAPGFKRREYPDGTHKVLYVDGTTKTIYSNGRVRMRDKNGSLISDYLA